VLDVVKNVKKEHHMRLSKEIPFVFTALTFLLPLTAYAQASIAGTVKDALGGVLPGVTVEAASTSLIEKTRTVVTDGTGQYKIVDLRPGTYTVTFTLSGFNTFKREGIELAGSFTATVNADLRVGTLQETITVTGESPIVDVQNVVQQRVLGKDVLEAIPVGRSHSNIAALIPGLGGGTDVGGTNNLSIAALSVHGGRTGNARTMIDGMSIGNAAGNGEASNFIPDITSTQEVSVTYAAGSADQQFSGVQINLVPREGGNSFKGSFYATGVNSSFQGSNYTQELQDLGLKTPNSIQTLYDINPGGGGPIFQDKLWFYAGARWQATKTYVAGLWENLNAGDPTKWTYAPDLDHQAVLPLSQGSVNTRLTWQASPRNKFGGYYEGQDRKWDSLSSTTSPEAPQHYDFPQNRVMTASWSSPLTNRLLFDVRLSDLVQGWRDRYPLENGPSTLKFGEPIPSVYRELITVQEQGGIIPNLIYRGGGNVSSTQPYITVKGWIASAQASLSYVTGAHAFKVGFLDTWGERAVDYNDTIYHVRYRFNNGIPNQLTEQATPFGFVNRMGADLGVFAQDKWTLKRLTLNLGVRFDYFDLYFPEQHLGPGLLVPTRDVTFPRLDYTSCRRDLERSTICSGTERRRSRRIWAAT
jgi:Carboxypeptidase regulatory-like domain